MKKLIAIATADWHIHRFRQFNDGEKSRLDWLLKMVDIIGGLCHIHNVPHLFAGDLVHTPKSVENETITRLLRVYKKSFDDKGVKTYAISGNHDLSEKNTLDHKSPSYLRGFNSFDNFILLDWNKRGEDIGDAKIWGIPYLEYDKQMAELIKKYSKEADRHKGLKILLLHSDMPGAKTPTGFAVGETEHIPRNLDKFFKSWDLVLLGHIHKHQRLSKKCIMLGTPIPLDVSQVGEACGYWEIFNDGSAKFVELDHFPKFIQLKEGEDIPDKPGIDYYIPYPEPLPQEEELSKKAFSITRSKKGLAKSYCKTKGIKSKSKVKELIKVLNHAE